MSTEPSIGKPVDRVDGRLKVTGGARYAAEMRPENTVYGVLVLSNVGKGKLLAVDSAEAEKAPGVLAVISHRNAIKCKLPDDAKAMVDPTAGEPLPPLQDDIVRYHGQPVAVVVADTFEHATRAAWIVKVKCREEKAVTEFAEALKDAFPPQDPKSQDRGDKKSADYRRGDPDRALADAPVKVEQVYTIPPEHHNPMELHATVAAWDGDRLTLWDKTQWVDNVSKQVAASFGMKPGDVTVISPFVGGAFGAALRAWPHVFIAAMAAKIVKRPVKLVLTRQQMYTVVGYRPHTWQRVALGADRDGKLLAIRHDGTHQTSAYEEYTESLLNPTRFLYACPNVLARYRIAAMNVNTPASMRGPGEVSGVYALECALDELAVALNLDPVELRLRNHADVDPSTQLPWSSKSLKECYREAAKRFGWEKRNPAPRSMRDGRQLIGWGMATATWPTHRQKATVKAEILADGTAAFRTAAHDIGPGTYTAMTQVAADGLGLPVSKVRFELGDSRLPPSPVEGGSMTMASVGTAVHEAAKALREKVQALGRGEDYAAILKEAGKQSVSVTHESKPPERKPKFSMHSFGAIFVEVRVDPDLGMVRTSRVVGGFAAGKIINPKTAHSQAIGGIVGGLGMALLEEGVRDARNGRFVNANLADYHMPVHPDVPPLEAFFIDEVDTHANPIGVKGLAELSIVGVAAAVANAVYHATGKRVRDLPITVDKLL